MGGEYPANFQLLRKFRKVYGRENLYTMKKSNCFKYKRFYIFFTLWICLGNGMNVYAFQQDSLARVIDDSQLEIDDSQLEKKVEQKVEVYSAVREELHRYMGYEELLPKYISLPYDVVMNTNIGTAFVDIGYLFLLFLPILLLFGLKNRLLKIATILLMLIFLIVSLPTGYRSNKVISLAEVPESIARELTETPFMSAPLINLKLQVTQLANTIYLPIHHNLIATFSGEGDAITYPIFFLFFLFTFLLLQDRFKAASIGRQAIPYFFLMYCFLWLILGAGVIWYGLLMLPLGLILLSVDALKKRPQTNFFKYIFLTFATIWLIGSTTYRFSNYSAPIDSSANTENYSQTELNTSAIHAGPLMYGLGRMDRSRLMNLLFPRYEPVLEIINEDSDALVYRIGTFFQYFIERNNERVLEDNQLAYFDNLYNLVPDKLKLVSLLKGQGYKYMVIDFNVHTIDKTPDQSLMKKTKRFEAFLKNNDGLEIIGTDRIVMNLQGQKVYGTSGGILVNSGTYVAYRLK